MSKCSQLFFTLLVALWVGACTRAPSKAPSDILLLGPNQAAAPLGHWLQQSRYTVVLFVSADCACVRAHAQRVQALSTRYAAQGVRFVAVNPEFDASEETLRSERQRHGWDFPLLLDAKAELAERLGAEYAGYAVVLDTSGSVHYRGGVDSDRKQTHDDATPYLANALDALVAGRPVKLAQTEALGCVLRRSGP